MSEHEEVIVRLDKSNTIIEEIVRCKDCRWYRDYDGCFFSTAEVEPLDYCSYGKRKTEEESIGEVVRGFMELVDATADRKTKPTISKMEQVDKDINVRSKDCETCKHYKLACELFSEICKYEPTTQTETQNSNLTFEKTERKCIDCNFLTYMFGKTWCNIKCENPHDKVCDRFKPKDEPQTETEIAKAVVHKMIDDAVIAEDAYPDLRQKMHDAVDEYKPQTDCAWR